MNSIFKFVFIVLSFNLVKIQSEPLLDALNGIQAFMEGGQPNFDMSFYDEFVQCLNQLDSRLFQSVGAQWDGMIEYANAGGSARYNDTWKTCDQNLKWFEYNCTVQEYGSMPIFEPCNYASNLAYYHTATEICGKKDWSLPMEQVTAMGITYAILGQGSAFLHGSQTSNGGAADTVLNDLFAFVAYQAMVEKLVPKENVLVHELSLTPREKSALEVTSEFVDLYIEAPVEEWKNFLKAADIPEIKLGMCGYFATVLTVLYEEEVVDQVVDYLIDAFELPVDIKEFCLLTFVPEIRNATRHIQLTSDDFFKLEGNTVSTAIKLIYAFLWQEQFLTTDEMFLTPFVNEVGAILLPYVNQEATLLNSWNYTNPDLQTGHNRYPGEKWCNPVIPHAKWHLQTSIALTDFTFLTDELFKVLAPKNKVKH